MTSVPAPDPRLLETAASWASRKAEGMLSAEEEREFLTWLDASPLHARALEQVDAGWLALADVANAPNLLAMRSAALERARRSNSNRWARQGFSSRGRVLALAAAVLLVVFVGALGWRLTPQTFETGIGERRVVAMADGSHISLDGATVVRVRYFNNRRQLWLDRGRAKFDVAHNPLQPFTVTAADHTVVATGTSFSVELVRQQFRVVLYSGSVSVLDGANGALRISESGAPRVVLTPGRELVAGVDASTASSSTAAIDPVRSRAWEGGQLMFDDEPLPIAIGRLNRYSHTQIVLGDDLVSTLRVSGVYNAGDVDAFLDGATRVLPIEAVQRGADVVLIADPETFSHDDGVNSSH